MILLQVSIMAMATSKQCLYVALMIQGRFTHLIQALYELKQ